MSLTSEKIPESDIKRYIFAEMTDEERDAFDEKVILDDGLFFEAADLENRLVDSYVAGDLAGNDLERFERSLAAIPSRREKIANARSLNTFIDEERPIAAVAERPAESRSIWQQIAGLLGGRSPSFAYGMAAAVVLLAAATGVLFLQNQRKNTELARLQDAQQRQAELQSELEQSRTRESELRSSIDAERDASGDLQDELDRERSRRELIERELGNLKNTTTTQPGPIIASVVLSPLGGRGIGGGPAVVKIGPETKRLSLRLALPDEVEAVDRLTVKLNQRPIARDIAPRISGRTKTINVSIPAANLNKGRNDLDVLDAAGSKVAIYSFEVKEK